MTPLQVTTLGMLTGTAWLTEAAASRDLSVIAKVSMRLDRDGIATMIDGQPPGWHLAAPAPEELQAESGRRIVVRGPRHLPGRVVLRRGETSLVDAGFDVGSGLVTLPIGPRPKDSKDTADQWLVVDGVEHPQARRWCMLPKVAVAASLSNGAQLFSLRYRLVLVDVSSWVVVLVFRGSKPLAANAGAPKIQLELTALEDHEGASAIGLGQTSNLPDIELPAPSTPFRRTRSAVVPAAISVEAHAATGTEELATPVISAVRDAAPLTRKASRPPDLPPVAPPPLAVVLPAPPAAAVLPAPPAAVVLPTPPAAVVLPTPPAALVLPAPPPAVVLPAPPPAVALPAPPAIMAVPPAGHAVAPVALGSVQLSSSGPAAVPLSIAAPRPAPVEQPHVEAPQQAALEPMETVTLPTETPQRMTTEESVVARRELQRRLREGLPLADLVLHGASLEGMSLRSAKLGGLDLRLTNLRGADMTGADLCRTNLDEATLDGATLDSAQLVGATLNRASLKNASMRGANAADCVALEGNFDGSNLSSADLRRSKLTGACLSRTLAQEVHADGADLTGADFTSAQLDRASLRKAIMCRATLRNARFSGADLADADLRGIEHDRALAGANLEGAVR